MYFSHYIQFIIISYEIEFISIYIDYAIQVTISDNKFMSLEILSLFMRKKEREKVKTKIEITLQSQK